MSSLARPGKRAPAPAPYYLIERNDIRYCYTCGRVINSKRSSKNQLSVVKYCSDSCRRRKPGVEDRKIEQLIISLLDGDEKANAGDDVLTDKSGKGDRRRLITCDDIENAFYRISGSEESTASDFRTKRNEFPSIEPPTSLHVSTAQISASQTAPHGEMLSSCEGEARPESETLPYQNSNKMLEGQKRAERRERVRRAARRAVVFGLIKPIRLSSRMDIETGASNPRLDVKMSQTRDAPPDPIRYKCEAVQNGRVIEPSFAKGDWGIRWRE